jgi:hypothetical protein
VPVPVEVPLAVPGSPWRATECLLSRLESVLVSRPASTVLCKSYFVQSAGHEQLDWRMTSLSAMTVVVLTAR